MIKVLWIAMLSTAGSAAAAMGAGQGVNGELNVAGRAFTLCVRQRDPGGNWMAPLLAKHGGHEFASLRPMVSNGPCSPVFPRT
jgi:hypothetical protein